MSYEVIGDWIASAKTEALTGQKSSRTTAAKRAPKAKGNVIMEIAEKIRPWIMKMFEGVRDENGMMVQPGRIRAIALNVAQDIAREQKQKPANA